MSIAKWFRNLSDKWVLAAPSIKNLKADPPKLLYQKPGKNISFGKAVAQFFLWPALVKAGKERVKNLLESDTFKNIDSAKRLLKEINELPFWAGVSENSLKSVLREAALSHLSHDIDPVSFDGDDYLQQLSQADLENYLAKPENLITAVERCLTDPIKNILQGAGKEWINSFSKIQSAVSNKDISKAGKNDKENVDAMLLFFDARDSNLRTRNPYRDLILRKAKDTIASFNTLSTNPSSDHPSRSLAENMQEITDPISRKFYATLPKETITRNNENIILILEGSDKPIDKTGEKFLAYLKKNLKSLNFSDYQEIKSMLLDLAKSKHPTILKLRSEYPSFWKIAYLDIEKKLLDYERKLHDEAHVELTNWSLIKHLEKIEKKTTELDFFLSFFSSNENKFEKKIWKRLGLNFKENLSELKKQVPDYLHDPLERLSSEFSTYLDAPYDQWKSAEIFKNSLREGSNRKIREETKTPESAEIFLSNVKNLIKVAEDILILDEALMKKRSSRPSLNLLEKILNDAVKKDDITEEDAFFLQEFIFNMKILLAKNSDELSKALENRLTEIQKTFFQVKPQT